MRMGIVYSIESYSLRIVYNIGTRKTKNHIAKYRLNSYIGSECVELLQRQQIAIVEVVRYVKYAMSSTWNIESNRRGKLKTKLP